MPTEYAQLLSTAHRVLDGECGTVQYTPIELINMLDAVTYQPHIFVKRGTPRSKKYYTLYDDLDLEKKLYQATHYNHPCAQWARENSANYIWLYELFVELLDEYEYRYERKHACTRLIEPLSKLPNNIPNSMEMTPPPLAMPEDYKTDDPIESYRKLYVYGKSHIANWKKRDIPSFFYKELILEEWWGPIT